MTANTPDTPDTLTVPRLRCLRCGYTWFPRRSPPPWPKRCPGCHGARWNEPYQRLAGHNPARKEAP